MLFFYTIGIVGCNKVGNVNMDGGGDRKDESSMKRQKMSESCDNPIAGSSSSVRSTSTALLQDSRLSMRNTADRAEEVAKLKEKNVEDAIKHARSARDLADKMRGFAGDLGTTGDSKYLQDSRLSMKNTADRAEEVAKLKEKNVEDEIKHARSARDLADKVRELTDRLGNK
ncbi:MAG: hypothetical protein QWI37_04735 [Candidatus Cardinium sp.]|nr:hypothetical protein [Candidatus Cardinium sp.]